MQLTPLRRQLHRGTILASEARCGERHGAGTAAEPAQNHCQMGNLKLALDVILQWVNEKT
jgi:hypothetical protein